jgi:hypothetical protein
MIPTYKEPYRDGDLRAGWASWDDGSLTARSIKYAYPDSSGKISRGSPELPVDILVDMLEFASRIGETDSLFKHSGMREAVPIKDLKKDELAIEVQHLKTTLLLIQKLAVDLPWAKFEAVYDQIGNRYENAKSVLATL